MSALKLVLFGLFGAGKGNQAQLLKEGLELPEISSYDLFRYHLQEGTFVLGADGRITHRFEGLATLEELEEALGSVQGTT